MVNCGLILGYALRRTANGDDAADVVAETFLTAWGGLTTCRWATRGGWPSRLWSVYAPTPGRRARSCSGSARPAPVSPGTRNLRTPVASLTPARSTGRSYRRRPASRGVVGTLLPWRQLGADVMTGAGPGQQ